MIGEACLDLLYPFIQRDNDPGPAAFIAAFFSLPLKLEKCACYIGSHTITLPVGSFGLSTSAARRYFNVSYGAQKEGK